MRRAKTKASRYPDKFGAKATLKISTKPMSNPPIMAPVIFPIPPTTAAVKAFHPGYMPISGWICGYLQAHNIPPAAAKPEPKAKV